MRDLVILRRRSEATDLVAAGLEAFVDRVDAPSGTAPVLDLPHPSDEARRRFAGGFPIAIDGLAWLSPGDSLPAAWSAAFEESFRYRVQSHVGWSAPAADEAFSIDVVKQVSFLHASASYGVERFRESYRHHVEIARKHMPALWQYVQNDVEMIVGEAAEAQGVFAVSELWFRTTEDFLERYFPSEADQREFSSHEDFLDLTQATSFICASARGVD